MKPLYNISIKILLSSLSILYLQKVLLIHLKKCVFYIMHKLKSPLRVLPCLDTGGATNFKVCIVSLFSGCKWFFTVNCLINTARVAKFNPKIGSRRTTKIKNLDVLVIILVVLILLPYYIYVILVLILLFLLARER